MRLLFVVPTLSSGGAERVVSVLSSTLAEAGREIHLVVHRHAHGEYKISDKVNVIYLDDLKTSKARFVAKIQRVLAVRMYIQKNKIDVVVPFLGSCMEHTFLATRGLRCKFVATLRNNPYTRKKSEKRRCDFIARYADANFVQNEEQKRYFSRRIQKKTFILTNPVDDSFFENKANKKTSIRNIIAVGRLNKQKNYFNLINAISYVLKSYPDVQVKIFGEGPEKKDIENYLQKKAMVNNIHLMGRTGNIIPELLSSDLFVLSSDFEGVPNALLEAMAVGLPCISTNCPTGPSMLIGDNKNGLLVPVADHEALGKAIIFMIENTKVANECAENAREFVRSNYSSNVIADMLYEECEKLL